ncbi:MAG: DUF1631 family protein [Pseudomonadota bacterium]
MLLHFGDLKTIGGDARQISELFQAKSAAPEVLRANTAEKLFTRLFSYEQPISREQLDAAFLPLLAKLKTAFILIVSKDDGFYCTANHPLRQLLECLLTRATTWYTRDSKANEMFYDKLADIVNLVTQWSSQTSVSTTEAAAIQKALFDFTTWNDGEEKRAALIESRLCESEINHLRMLTAECQVLDLINDALAGKTLPLPMLETIPSTLKNELQNCVFTAGIDSDFWRLWKRLLPLIANVFTGTKSEQDDQKMYREIPAMLNELERSLQMGSSHSSSYDFLIEILSNSLVLAVQKQSQSCATLNALAYPEGHSAIHTRVTDSVLQQAVTMQAGEWILFSGEENQTIRCKLALKNAGSDQLLFVDRNGRKVMIKSSKDFALCLSTGIAKPLTKINLEEVIAKLVQALMALPNNIPAPIASEITVQPEISATPKKTTPSEKELLEIQQKQQVSEQIDLRRASAHKAIAEARALADEKARRTSEAKKMQSEREKEENLELAQQQVNALNVGAWVEMPGENQHSQRCKLAVIIASVGKYIFVDNLGRKMAEYNREELLQALLNQQLKLINNGDKFEEQLVKVIRSLRKDIS